MSATDRTTNMTHARVAAVTQARLGALGRVADDASIRVELWWESQRPRMKLALGLAAVFAAAGLMNLVGSGLTRATAPRSVAVETAVRHAPPALVSESAPADAGKAWSVVKVWQGSGGRETESFTVSDHWRVDWLFNPAQPNAQIQVFIYAADGRLLLNVAANTPRAGADTSFWAGPGTYFLKVNATGGDWKLDVQDLH